MFKITNVKLSLKISFSCLDTVIQNLSSKEIQYKSYNNFIVFKNIYTYILFKSKDKIQNHLNITNISNLEKVENAICIYKDMFQSVNIISQTIDNITASFTLNKSFNFLDVIENFKDIAKVSYNSEKFPGIFIKFPIGTVIIFHTGKCIIIGCKSVDNLEWLVKKINAYI